MKKFAIYIRVSTRKQGESQLGLEAQAETCRQYINSVGGELSATFQDVESGKSRTRKGLWEAIDYCLANDATLVFAKLDRLARDIEFTFKVMNTGIDVHFCDMPVVNTIILGVFAAVAQYERELTSARTKAALAAKKERDGMWSDQYGKNTGRTHEETCKIASVASANARKEKAKDNPQNLFFWRYITQYEQRRGSITANTSLGELVEELNNLGAKTATGLDFNVQRARVMLSKVKSLYN